MFTINIYLRFALIGLCLIGGTILAILYGFWYAFPFLLTGIILLIGYILLGTVQSAAQFMNAADFEKTEKRLALTLNHKWLFSSNKAYYYMIKGTIAMANKKTDEGEEWLRKAQEVNVPTDNEKAMIELQLGQLSASKNKWQQAQAHYRNVKQLKITEPTIKDQLKEFEKALNNRGQMKAAQRMGGQKGAGAMRPGGKRRRPKMR